MKYLFSSCLALFSLFLNAQQPKKLDLLWKSDTVFQFAEGVVNSQNDQFLYVSNTIGSPMEKDGKGTISTIDFNGKLIAKDLIVGMNAPKDIQRYKNILYAADLDELVVIDLNQNKITQKIKIPGTSLLHNIAIDSSGIVYVSDMFAGTVHKVVQGVPILYLEKLNYAAGLLLEGKDLLVLTNGSLIKYDEYKNKTILASGMDERLNGIVKINKNEYVVSSWGGVLYYVHSNGTHQVLLDTRSAQIPCGIVYYDIKKEVLYMTTDQFNILNAYKIK